MINVSINGCIFEKMHNTFEGQIFNVECITINTIVLLNQNLLYLNLVYYFTIIHIIITLNNNNNTTYNYIYTT